MSEPTTWALVTVKGRPELTERCVNALIGRTTVPLNIFAVDNGSRDATLDFLYRKFRRGEIHRLLCNKVETVPQWQKSYAICQAAHSLRMEHYDYFVWIDNDVVVDPGWLKAAQIVLAGRGDVHVASMHDDATQEKFHPTRETATVGGIDIKLKDTANGALWVMRREFFDMFGLPPTNLGITQDGTEDWYYSRIMRERKVRFAVVGGYSKHHGYKDSAKKVVLRNGG